MTRGGIGISRQETQRGVALLIVLLLLATLSALALAMTGTMARATARAQGAEALDQIRWYALGTEQLAGAMLEKEWAAAPEIDNRMKQWLREPTVFPLDNGVITVTLTDATLCFNVNSLVIQEEEGDYETNPEARERFTLLLSELGFDLAAQEGIADVLTDWLDSDDSPEPGGAEDGDYARLGTPYRTGNMPLADLSEMRAMMGISPPLYARLQPYLCALPTTDPAPLDINLVTQAHAPLIVAAFGGALSNNEAEGLIAQVPAEGFTDIEQLWALPILADKELTEEVRDRFSLYSSYLRMKADVNYAQAFILQESLLHRGSDGTVGVVRRRLGPGE